MKRLICAVLTCTILLGLAGPLHALGEGTAYREAPMLAQRVASGELPPV